MYKILAIDDQGKFRDLLKSTLEKEGYEVTLANDGEDGIRKAGSGSYDLVICDMMMPKKDGFDVLKALRGELKSGVPFIMLTSIDDFDKIKTAYDYEANFYVTKPVRHNQLFETTKLMENVRVLLSLPKNG
jgi:DNA-binding response OmpR family regulator